MLLSFHLKVQYYYEPGTPRQFRSLISVQKYLSGETNVAPRPKTMKPDNVKNVSFSIYFTIIGFRVNRFLVCSLV